MTQYFVDAWYLIAIINRADHDHAAARRLERLFGSAPLVSQDAVLMEVLAFYAGLGVDMRRRAAAAVRDTMRIASVLPSDHGLFLAGLHLYERRPDKEYSLIDCMSMELMRAQNIRYVLTNDHHFRQEGFTVLSDAP